MHRLSILVVLLILLAPVAADAGSSSDGFGFGIILVNFPNTPFMGYTDAGHPMFFQFFYHFGFFWFFQRHDVEYMVLL